MKKKKSRKLDIYEQQKEAYWKAYDRALLMKDNFFSVASSSICIESGLGGNSEPSQLHFGPEGKAFF